MAHKEPSAEDHQIAKVLAHLAARVVKSGLDPHRITVMRARDDVYVYRVYEANDKDYDGGQITPDG